MLTSFLDGRAAVEVERPEERFAMGGADETGGFQNRSHALGRVDEDAKGIACEAEEEVPKRESCPDVPAVAGIGEGE